jgi:predicted nucleic-acid-binding Zn-ribbon protein
MNTRTERNKCRYCQIDLVNIQQLTALTTKFSDVENKQTTSSVMKCPVCGYSELSKLSLVENHSGYSKISIQERQAPVA